MVNVIYFVNFGDPTRPKGWLLLAPMTHCPAPRGYELREASTLPEIDHLERTLQEQEASERSADLVHDEKLMGPIRDEIRQRLYSRMTSADCPQFERDFIGAYLSHRIDRRSKWHQKYLEYQCYLKARHFDTPKGRGDGEESVNLDRIA